MKNLETMTNSLIMNVKNNASYASCFTKKNEAKATLKDAITTIEELLNGEQVFIYNKYGNSRFTTYTLKKEVQLAMNILNDLYNLKAETGNNSASKSAKYGEFIWLSDEQKDILLNN